MKSIDIQRCQGYIEGYYGKLLSWDERAELVEQLQACGLSSYFYAPKEDVYHRFHWREPYPQAWREQFSAWVADANTRHIKIIAGLAPGLDFDFSHLPTGADFAALVEKAEQLLDDGVHAIALLMDDINTQFQANNSSAEFEGQAHAQLANALAKAIDRCIFVVPRVYAQELEHESINYATSFSAELDRGHVVFHCGSHIVAPSVSAKDYADYANAKRHRIVVWDNYYANDYCPRRLFVGPWNGRAGLDDVMLNPTGLPATDALLLDVMANTINNDDASMAWKKALEKHGVPHEFEHVFEYFNHPPFDHLGVSSYESKSTMEQQLAAVEVLLWKWKTPLSREWYLYLFGLKHDLLINAGQLPELRIRKTQLAPLAKRLNEF